MKFIFLAAVVAFFVAVYKIITLASAPPPKEARATIMLWAVVLLIGLVFAVGAASRGRRS